MKKVYKIKKIQNKNLFKKIENDMASDYIKANRKGSRDAELEFSNGWVCKHKIHKSKKTYSRKNNKQK